MNLCVGGKRFVNLLTFTSEVALTTARMLMRNVGDAMGVFTRSVLRIPCGKILDKNCESLCWCKRFANLLSFI